MTALLMLGAFLGTGLLMWLTATWPRIMLSLVACLFLLAGCAASHGGAVAGGVLLFACGAFCAVQVANRRLFSPWVATAKTPGERYS